MNPVLGGIGLAMLLVPILGSGLAALILFIRFTIREERKLAASMTPEQRRALRYGELIAGLTAADLGLRAINEHMRKNRERDYYAGWATWAPGLTPPPYRPGVTPAAYPGMTAPQPPLSFTANPFEMPDRQTMASLEMLERSRQIRENLRHDMGSW